MCILLFLYPQEVKIPGLKTKIIIETNQCMIWKWSEMINNNKGEDEIERVSRIVVSG